MLFKPYIALVNVDKGLKILIMGWNKEKDTLTCEETRIDSKGAHTHDTKTTIFEAYITYYMYIYLYLMRHKLCMIT